MYNIQKKPSGRPISELAGEFVGYTQGNMTIGRLARIIIKDFRDYVESTSIALIYNDQEQPPQQKYQLFKSYINNSLSADEIAQFIKLEHYNLIQEFDEVRISRGSLSNNLSILEKISKSVVEYSDEIIAQSLDLTRPVLSYLVSEYEKAQGWK
ncbi:hypothetical protein HYW20_08940 [Candidatus Woesearchaeota archaeon]|nr:hypothetical protein [Candidatus Woesearchaeota archaeon]